MRVFIPVCLILYILGPIFGFITAFFAQTQVWKVTLGIVHFLLGAVLIPYSIFVITFRYFVGFGG
jgi:hypothetical protein